MSSMNCDGTCVPYCVLVDGECTQIVEGCTDSAACNYNSEANVDDGSCEYPPNEFTNCDGNMCSGCVLVDENVLQKQS